MVLGSSKIGSAAIFDFFNQWCDCLLPLDCINIHSTYCKAATHIWEILFWNTKTCRNIVLLYFHDGTWKSHKNSNNSCLKTDEWPAFNSGQLYMCRTIMNMYVVTQCIPIFIKQKPQRNMFTWLSPPAYKHNILLDFIQTTEWCFYIQKVEYLEMLKHWQHSS